MKSDGNGSSGGKIDIESKVVEFLDDNPSLKNPEFDIPTKASPTYAILYQIANQSGLSKQEILSQIELSNYLEIFLDYLISIDLIVKTDTGLKVDDTVFSQAQSVQKDQTGDDLFVDEEDLPKGVIDPGSTISIPEGDVDDPSIRLEHSSKTRDRLRQELESGSQAEAEDVDSDEELDQLFDDVLGETLEDAMSDFEDYMLEDDEEGKTKIIEPVVGLLREYNYIDADDEDQIRENREYNIMLIIIQDHPVSQEVIEKNLENLGSLSMVMSNLQADNLIKQTNDYQWTISKQTEKAVKDFISSHKSTDTHDEDSHLITERADLSDTTAFVKTCEYYNYIDDEGSDIADLIEEYTEFEVLNLIREYEPITTDQLKDRAEALPVVVKRMVSRLHADDAITRDSDGRWSISPNFQFFMVRDQLKAELDEDRFDALDAKYQ